MVFKIRPLLPSKFKVDIGNKLVRGKAVCWMDGRTHEIMENYRTHSHILMLSCCELKFLRFSDRHTFLKLVLCI